MQFLYFVLRRFFVGGGVAVFPDAGADFVAGARGRTEHAVQGAQVFQGFGRVQAAHFGIHHPENKETHINTLVHNLKPLRVFV